MKILHVCNAFEFLGHFVNFENLFCMFYNKHPQCLILQDVSLYFIHNIIITHVLPSSISNVILQTPFCTRL